MLMRESELNGTPIDGYGPGGFRVDGEWHEGSILLTSDGVFSCDFEKFDKGLISEETILLIGTGSIMAPLPPSFRVYLEDHAITYDVMQTSSACRTYNVLLAESRSVAALLTSL